MTDPISRILLILASSNNTRADLRVFAKWIERHGALDFVDAIESLRDCSASVARLPASSSTQIRPERTTDVSSSRQSGADNLILKIQNVLLTETGLQKHLAANMLSDGLREELGQSANIPEYNKIAFEVWLSRLLERNPNSIVLQVATRIGKSRKSGQGRSLDWSLKKE